MKINSKENKIIKVEYNDTADGIGRLKKEKILRLKYILSFMIFYCYYNYPNTDDDL